MDVFSAKTYKEYLHYQVDRHGHVKGYKSRLSEAARCQNSFLSQVLHSHADLTPEHALGLTYFWEFSEEERSHFLDLVHLARAGTVSLRDYLSHRLDESRENRTGARPLQGATVQNISHGLGEQLYHLASES